MRAPLVLCLGNEVHCDDAFGPTVADRLSARAKHIGGVEIISAATAGFALLDLLCDRPRVLIVDAIVTGHARPGTLHLFDAGELAPSNTLTGSHQISLPTALALGRALGAKMPEKVTVLAVEALDVNTLSEQMTPPIIEAIEPALRQIERWIESVSSAVPVTDRNSA